jgi:peptidoglycan/LPS O-acetylase OafA/YrhL
MRLRAGRLSAANPHEKLAFIEGMRGAAALYVVLGHFVNMVDPGAAWSKSAAPAWMQVLTAPFQNGHLAVAAFIVISGFCLQLSLFGGRDGRIHDVKRFFARRAWRILPAYYACLAISVVVALTVTSTQTKAPFTQYVPVTWENISAHVLMVHNLSAGWMYKINGVLWSIAIEAQLYLLFPLIVASLFRVGRFWTVVLCAAAAAALLGVAPEAIKLYPWYLPLFGVGMAAAHFAYRPNLTVGTVPALAAGIAICSVAGVILFSHDIPMAFADALIGLAAAAVMYLGSVAPSSRMSRAFGWKPLVGLGAFSYSLYLLHHPVQQVLYVYRPWIFQGPALKMTYLVVLGLPVVLGVSYLFSLLFERPFTTRKAGSAKTDNAHTYTPISLPLKAYSAPKPKPRQTPAPIPRTAVVPAPAPRASTLL